MMKKLEEISLLKLKLERLKTFFVFRKSTPLCGKYQGCDDPLIAQLQMHVATLLDFPMGFKPLSVPECFALVHLRK